MICINFVNNINKMEFIIENKYKLAECLGRGSFGALYAGWNIKSNEPVAVKLEPLSSLTP